jgi:hypothetical protein
MAPVPRDAKVYVAGHQGLVGGAIWRALKAAGFTNLVGRTREELDLTDEAAVDAFYAEERPEYVYVAAAKVGGGRGGGRGAGAGQGAVPSSPVTGWGSLLHACCPRPALLAGGWGAPRA